MKDLEDRLRDELQHEADDFDPSPDLPKRIASRIERRTQRNHLLAAAAAVLLIAAVAGGLLALREEPGNGNVDTIGPGRETTSTTEPERETTTSTARATTTSRLPQHRAPEMTLPPSTTTTTAPTPAFDRTAPLSRWGIGPIRAGMTIREAEEAAGITLAPHPDSWEGFGRTCAPFWIDGVDGSAPSFVAWTPDRVPSDDPRSAVIHAVGGAGLVTEEGLGVGATVNQVYATYGQPTSTTPDNLSMDPDARILIYEQGGFSYGFRTWEGQVQDVASGHITGLAEFEPCQ